MDMRVNLSVAYGGMRESLSGDGEVLLSISGVVRGHLY